MRKNRHHSQAQLVLELDRQNPTTPVERNTKGLVEALADLLLGGLAPKRSWEASMNPKITPDHVGRTAVVYVPGCVRTRALGAPIADAVMPARI